MITAEFRSTANIVQQNSFSVQPQPAAKEDNTASGSNAAVHLRRDVNFVSLEDSKTAKALVEKSDSNMAIKYALALAKGEASPPEVERGLWNPQIISDIEPNSSFGMAWANFTAALKAEPFATFARENNIDTSSLCWDAERHPGEGAFLQTWVNGQPRFFHDDFPGWKRASAAITSAINLLGSRVIYTGNDSNAPAGLVGSFYGSFPAQDQRLSEIGKLLNTRSFSSLSDSKSPYHRNMIDFQQQAIQAVASQPHSGAQPAETVAAQVMEADNEVARMSASALLLLKHEIRPADARPMAGYIITPPEHSTIGQTIKAFNKAFQADAFLDFAREKKLDLSTVCIDPRNGDLKVIDGPNRSIRTLARVNDQSGWAQVSSEIRALAKKLGEGTNEVVPYNPDGSISMGKVLSFYGEPSVNRTLPETIKSSSALYHKGFLALNPDTSPTDERAHAVKQKQLTVIQKLEDASIVQPVTSVLDKTPAKTIAPATSIANGLFFAAPSLYSALASLLGVYVQRTAHGAGDLDINHLSIGVLDPENPGERKDIPLMQYAMDALSNSKSLSIPAGAQLFDTRPDLLAHTGTPGYVPVPIDMNALKKVLLRLPTQVETIYIAANRDYWSQPAFTVPAVYNGSRQSLLSRFLQDNLQRAGLEQSGLDAEQRKTVDMVVNHPEGSTRAAPQDPNSSPATVYRLTNRPGNDDTPNLLIHRFLEPNREILLLVEPSGKITPYDSWDALDQAGHVKSELTGNPFDTQASIIIDGELGDTLSVNPSAADAPSQTQAAAQPPAWVNQANDSQRVALAHLMLELAGFVQRNKGQSYDYAIDDLRTFAQKQFDSQLPHPRSYNTSQIEVEFKTPSGSLFAGAGGGGEHLGGHRHHRTNQNEHDRHAPAQPVGVAGRADRRLLQARWQARHSAVNRA